MVENDTIPMFVKFSGFFDPLTENELLMMEREKEKKKCNVVSDGGQ